MSGMIDGVSKLWTLRLSKSGGLDITGFKSELAAAKQLCRHALIWGKDTPEERQRWRDALEEVFAEEDQEQRDG